jgi:hypothetical protein
MYIHIPKPPAHLAVPHFEHQPEKAKRGLSRIAGLLSIVIESPTRYLFLSFPTHVLRAFNLSQLSHATPNQSKVLSCMNRHSST